jgi:transcriptional regulator with XRE-family HTH domain
MVVERIGPFGQQAAAQIAAIRSLAGLSLAEVSRRTGGEIAELALRRIEKRERRIDVDDLFRLSGALGVSIDELLGRPDPQTVSNVVLTAHAADYFNTLSPDTQMALMADRNELMKSLFGWPPDGKNIG